MAQAKTVAAFIRALDIDRPVLVGHSLGDTVALATAVAHPTLVRAPALVAPITRLPATPPATFKELMVKSPPARTPIGWTLATPLSTGIQRVRVVERWRSTVAFNDSDPLNAMPSSVPE